MFEPVRDGTWDLSGKELGSKGKGKRLSSSTDMDENLKRLELVTGTEKAILVFHYLQKPRVDANQISKEDDLLNNLRQNARRDGFIISNNSGGGNCMFYALAEQLRLVKGISISHVELRRRLVAFLQSNPKLANGTDLYNFVAGYSSWSDYLKVLGKDGSWGDHVVLVAAANCFQVVIRIISSLPDHPNIAIGPESPVDITNPLVLGHVHELHYVSLLPEQALSRKELGSKGKRKRLSSSTDTDQTLKRLKLVTGTEKAILVFHYLQKPRVDANQISEEDDLLNNLRQNARRDGFIISNNPGGGNCMFYALAEQLRLVKGISISHVELRRRLVAFLQSNPKLANGTDLYNFVAGYSSWSDYLKVLGKDGSWGDHVVLVAAANCFQVVIRIISSLPDHPNIAIGPESPVDITNPLVLGHVHELHYVSLLPVQGFQRGGHVSSPSETESHAHSAGFQRGEHVTSPSETASQPHSPGFQRGEHVSSSSETASQPHSAGSPPQLMPSFALPRLSDLEPLSKPWNEVKLPIDALLLTVNDCEFSSCYVYLKDPFCSYYHGLGYVYFGTMGEGQVTAALLKCVKGAAGPGGSLTVVKNAADVLRPKLVISVGTCGSLRPKEAKLGDVVLAAKLTTYARKEVRNDRVVSCGVRTLCSRDTADLIKHAAIGWKAPLENPKAREITVHSDSEVLSGPELVNSGWRKEELIEQHPTATAIEMEGEGVFSAAYDLRLEWLVVKGISNHADGTTTETAPWKPFASTMAASVVCHMLKNPVVLREWPHYKGSVSYGSTPDEQHSARHGKISLPFCSHQTPKRTKRKTKCHGSNFTYSATKPLDLNQCQDQLRSLYNTMSQVKITPWDEDNTVHIDEVYTQLSWLRDDKKPSGTTQEKLRDYSDIFEGHKNYPNPKRILVYGRPGIGKSTFSKKIAVDWSSGRKEILKKFDLLLLVKLRDACDLEEFHGVLKAADLLSADGLTSVDSLYDYVRQNQERVLLILDGYDEYHCSADKSSPVVEMWKSSQLRHCCIVMTTRPVKADELKKFSHVQSEIRGFDTVDQVKEFAMKFLTEKNEVDMFTGYLSKQKLWDLAEIPLLLLMLCLLWKKRGSVGLPTSRLDLYERFVQTLLYHVQEKDSCDSFQTINECKDELTAIGKVAFEGLLNDCLYFRSSDLPRNILREKFVRVGLFQISKLSTVDPQEGVVFVHKSIQEYLAAWFIVHELDSAAIDSLRKVRALEEVLKFVCEWSEDGLRAVLCHLGLVGRKEGLTDYKFTETPSVKDLTQDQKKFLKIALDCFISSPFSGKPEMLSLLLSSVGGVLLIDFDHLPVLAAKHLLKSTSLPNFVFFSWYYRSSVSSFLASIMDDVDALVVTSAGEMKASGLVKRYGETINEMVPYLKKEDGKVCLYFSVLDASDNDAVDLLREVTVSSPENIGGTTNQTRHYCLKFLKEIDIKHYEQISGIINVLNDVLPLVSYPHEIQISGSSFAGEVESITMSRINFNNNLSKLDLQALNLTAEAASVVATSLHQAPNLHHLDLSRNPLCGGVSQLAENLHHVPQLSSLELRDVSMGDRECSSLASSLKFVPQLDKLDLSFNPLRHGVTDLANHLNSVPLLTELSLSGTQMGEEEAGALGRALKCVPQLKRLWLQSNPLGRGVSVLIQHLSSVPELNNLGLDNTQMGEEEAGALGRVLKYIPQLKRLQLGYNPLGRGVTVLIQHLSSVPKLQYLFLWRVQMTKREVDDLTTALVHRTHVLTDYHEDRLPHSEEELKRRGIQYAVEGQMNFEERDGTPKPQCEWQSYETGSEDETGTGSEDEWWTGSEDETGTGPEAEMAAGSEAETGAGPEAETGAGSEAETEAGTDAYVIEKPK